jgi:hypothetical protein
LESAVHWSIDVRGESPFEVGSLVVRILQDRYKARIDGYDVAPDGQVSVSVELPKDPWTRRIMLHWAQADRNRVLIHRARQLSEAARRHCDETQTLLERLRKATAGVAVPKSC